MSFVHLRTHSHYSLLSALPKIPDLIETAKENGMNALGLTDNGNLYAAIEFYKEAKKAGVKPIIGVDAYLAGRTRHDKQAGIDNKRKRLVLLAENETGYKNLLKLVTAGNLEGFYYKPRIDRELLTRYSEGLIAIIPFGNSDIREALDMNEAEKVDERINFYKETFRDRLYLELARQTDTKETSAEKRLIACAEKHTLPLVAGHSVYYLSPDDRKIQRVLMSVQNGGVIRERTDEDELDLSFLTAKDALKKFKDMPEALARTQEIADRCNLTLELGKWVFPDFKLAEGRTPDEELAHVVEGGFARRNYPRTPETEKRAQYELKVIRDKGYSPYFLIVADLLAYARSHGILSNIRGSVSGSLVTYLSGITNIDPLEYEIPFERFLNPDRPSPPDIDMDFADNRRDEMIDYARSKYGRDKVAQIGTFGTMMARGSVRDVSRALGFDYGTGDRIAKLIPMGSQGFPMTIDKALELTPELKDAYKKEDEVKQIIDTAKRIEGCARHIGVHAAGVVIAPTDLVDFTALQFDPKGEDKVITQYDMYSIEEAGLLKFDFLGLKNLSIIADTINLVKKTAGVELDVDTLPIDDKKTFDMLARGETSDLFQLNGDGMTRYLKELRPTSIHDINAMVALYRPGPLQFIPLFIERKHNARKISYLDPALEPILKKTYGILVYQDDLLMMAKELAGYSWGEVDKFRKAVGKKIPEEMAAQKEKFISGCVKHSGWPLAKAQQIWEWIEPFAAYGFNKAHSVSYGRVAYETAYLKANYPGEYMTSILTHEAGDVDKVGETVAECTRMNMPVLPPSINESFREFTLIKGATGESIRFGLGSIKNVGEGIADAIIDERTAKGRFATLSDFLSRVQNRNMNKKSLESMIKAGALDDFGERGQLLANMDTLLEWNKEAGKGAGAQDSLFGSVSGAVSTIRLADAPPASATDKLSWEKELLGLYLSGHPLDKHRTAIEKHGITIKKIREELPAGVMITVAGLIESARPIITKKGSSMMFLRIADFTGAIEVVVFPKLFDEAKAYLTTGTCIALKGRAGNRNGELSIVAEKVKKLD
jgi:DNA polymerase-3 subunit alpha